VTSRPAADADLRRAFAYLAPYWRRLVLVMAIVTAAGLRRAGLGTGAVASILLLYLVQWGISAFTGYGGMSFVFGGGTFGILFSVFVVCIAALNLVLDFDLIERGVAQGAPRYMEWYCAFALMVTLVWLYLELLRLLGNTRR